MSGPVNVYSQNAGTAVINQPIVFAAAPGPSDVNYNLGQIVIVPTLGAAYILVSKSTSNGIVSATWTTLSFASGDIDMITATNNSGTVLPVSGNVNMTGDGSIQVLGSGDTLTVSLIPSTDHAVLLGTGTSTIGTVGPLTNGQLVIGSTGVDPVAAVLTSSGGSVTITNGAGSINLEAAATALVVNGDVASATGNPLTLTGGSSGAVFTGSGSTLTESFNFLSLPDTTTTDGQIIIDSLPFLHAFDSGGDNNNVFVGASSGNFTNTSEAVIGIGKQALSSIVDASNAVAVGFGALGVYTTGFGTVAIGSQNLGSMTSGDDTVSIGVGNASFATSLSDCVLLGAQAGKGYAGGEHDNIIIGSNNLGTAAELNVLRIGNGTGTAQGNLNSAFVCGIAGITSANSALVTINTTTNQLGSVATVATASGAASGSVALNARIGSITFTGVSIAAAATLALTMSNTSITGAGTRVIFSMSGATTASAVTVASYVPSASQLIWNLTNGTGATTSTANITFDFIVLN